MWLRNGAPMKRLDTDCIPPVNTPPPAAPSLETILAELRRLAIGALDGGHPVVAARMPPCGPGRGASWPRPPRPRYGAGTRAARRR